MNVLNVGVIGCGRFARGVHIPLLQKNPKYRIRAVGDIDGKLAAEIAQGFGADYGTGDIDELLRDPNIDAVFVVTRHDSHAELSVRAANAGKHILCEKPMGLSAEECRSVVEAVRRNGVKYTIGYNRGMAPLVSKARELLDTIDGKKMIYHRIQAPFPEDEWTHDPAIGGGRFVGEGCHIFDLLCELVGAPPTMVYASGGTFLDPEKVRIPDSAVVTITFADGSVGTTLISSAGCVAFPKESTEVYCSGKAIFVNDFKEILYSGFPEQEVTRFELDAQDKGQAAEIDQFADAVLHDTESPNGLVRAARAAIISYKVNESVSKGAAVPMSPDEYMFQSGHFTLPSEATIGSRVGH
jgi:predicted dehydrogenase